MQLRITRSIPLAEVRTRVEEIEAAYGGSLENIPDQFASGLVGREAFENYVEWMGMVHAIRAWGEGEDFDYITEDVIEMDRSEAKKLTPRRMELLDQLSRNRADSINDLASKIGRDVKNVYNDLKILEGIGFIQLVRDGRKMIPELRVHEVTILLW